MTIGSLSLQYVLIINVCWIDWSDIPYTRCNSATTRKITKVNDGKKISFCDLSKVYWLGIFIDQDQMESLNLELQNIMTFVHLYKE